MKTPSLRRTYKRYPKYQKKARAAFTQRTLIPRNSFGPMPQKLLVAVTNSQQANYTASSGLFAGFSIDCGTLLGLASALPPYVYKLLTLYSQATVKKVTSEVRFLSLGAVTDGLDIASGVITNEDFAAITTFNQDIMDKLRAMPGSTSSFMGSYSGGHDVALFKRTVDLDTWCPNAMPECSTTTSKNSASTVTYTISQPSSADSNKAPAIVFVYTPVRASNTDFQVIRTITYHIVFSGLHLG